MNLQSISKKLVAFLTSSAGAVFLDLQPPQLYVVGGLAAVYIVVQGLVDSRWLAA